MRNNELKGVMVRSHSGFTLVELMVVIAILAAIAAIAGVLPTSEALFRYTSRQQARAFKGAVDLTRAYAITRGREFMLHISLDYSDGVIGRGWVAFMGDRPTGSTKWGYDPDTGTYFNFFRNISPYSTKMSGIPNVGGIIGYNWCGGPGCDSSSMSTNSPVRLLFTPSGSIYPIIAGKPDYTKSMITFYFERRRKDGTPVDPMLRDRVVIFTKSGVTMFCVGSWDDGGSNFDTKCS